jgi:hypothetical protein
MAAAHMAAIWILRSATAPVKGRKKWSSPMSTPATSVSGVVSSEYFAPVPAGRVDATVRPPAVISTSVPPVEVLSDSAEF